MLAINPLFPAMIAFLFYKILSSFLTDPARNREKRIIGLFILVIMFSWIQHRNMVWAFQSQFFMVFLIPLYSFYCLSKYKQTEKRSYFNKSLLFGVLSTLTMVNGIFALPLILILAFIFKLDPVKKTVLILTTTIVLIFFFYDYKFSSGGNLFSETLLHHKINFFLYVLTYLGGPFYFLFGKSSLAVAQTAGFILVLATFFLIIKTARARQDHPMAWTLIFFLIYIGLTAFATASGRLTMGVKQAIASRYMTPGLMAWLAFFILLIHFNKSKFYASKMFLVLLVTIPLLLFPYQFEALRKKDGRLFGYLAAALSLEMGTHDDTYIKTIKGNKYQDIFTASQKPIQRNLSIFGQAAIKDAQRLLGASMKNIPSKNFKGYLGKIEPIGPDIYRINGWVCDDETKSVPANLIVLNAQKKIIGYAIAGMPRLDVALKIGPHAKFSGFLGYIKRKLTDGEPILLVNKAHNKSLSGAI